MCQQYSDHRGGRTQQCIVSIGRFLETTALRGTVAVDQWGEERGVNLSGSQGRVIKLLLLGACK